MLNKTNIIFLLTILLLHSTVFAQTETNDTDTVAMPRLKLDFPLLDFPYQLDAMDATGGNFLTSYSIMSMQQSLAISQNAYSSFHFGMKQFHNNSSFSKWATNVIYYGGVALGNILMQWMPFGTTWLHEEYHRASLATYKINTENLTYLFPIGMSEIPVKVDNRDSARMGKKNKPDLIRSFSVGMEGEYMLIDSLQRNNFFYNQQLLHEFYYWQTTSNLHIYLTKGESGDFVSWSYLLFNADEWIEFWENPPADIATHEKHERKSPRKHLHANELEFLELQGKLHYLNYISPMMFGIRRIPIGTSGTAMNFAMRHQLTSFGYDISARVFLQKAPFNMVFTLHNYMNYRNWFPAIEAELVDFPVTIGSSTFLLSPRVLIGVQPQAQGFKTSSPEFLGLIGLRVDYMVTKNIFPYTNITAKTNGHIAGIDYSTPSVSAQMGLSLRF